MAVDRQTLIRAVIRGAILEGRATGKKPFDLMQSIVRGRFGYEASTGTVVIGAAEAGGSTTLTLVPGLGPAEVMGIAEEACQLMEQFPDPNAPAFPKRRMTRMRVSFGNAVL